MTWLIYLLLWSSLGYIATIKGQSIHSFEIPFPTGQIYEGAQVKLECRVERFVKSTDAVAIYQSFNGSVRHLATETGKHDEAPDNVASSGIESYDSTAHVLSVIINDIDVSFSGDYSCYFAKKAGTIITQRQLSLTVLMPTPPSCSVATPDDGDDLLWYEGDQVTLTCVSDVVQVGPLHVVVLSWIVDSPNDNLPPLPNADAGNLTTSDMTEKTIRPRLTSDHDGVTFTCVRETDRQNCSIGPIQVRRIPTMGFDSTDSTFTSSLNSTVRDGTVMPKNATPAGGLQFGILIAIVASAVAVVVIIIITVAICCCITRSSSPKTRTPSKKAKDRRSSSHEMLTINMIPMTGDQVSSNGGGNHSNSSTPNLQPVSVKPSNGEIIQPTTKPRHIPQVKMRVTSKKYPAPPSYPRPPKVQQQQSSQESDGGGEHYANARVGSGIPGDSAAQRYSNVRIVSGIPEVANNDNNYGNLTISHSRMNSNCEKGEGSANAKIVSDAP